MTNTPFETLRDGAITATIWKNTTNDNKTFYSVDIVRSYKDQQSDQWKDTHSFSGAELLRVANLSQRAYNRILEARAATPEANADNLADHYQEHASGGAQ